MVRHLSAISISCCFKEPRICWASSSHSRALARYSSALVSRQSPPFVPPFVRYLTNAIGEELFRQTTAKIKHRNRVWRRSPGGRHMTQATRASILATLPSRSDNFE